MNLVPMFVVGDDQADFDHLYVLHIQYPVTFHLEQPAEVPAIESPQTGASAAIQHQSEFSVRDPLTLKYSENSQAAEEIVIKDSEQTIEVRSLAARTGAAEAKA